ncbi:Clavaminate synthase-like protein [Ascodesmis nigricans]|uniref:Clavaminate synthase-like protein n=1 Tax=Ascodesmis nigricans TaxID=341454 RepID=A0A4S2N6S4_9PEZI|nr:Clavaminate synthase-like protein [Ascodesmis nigricans]
MSLPARSIARLLPSTLGGVLPRQPTPIVNGFRRSFPGFSRAQHSQASKRITVEVDGKMTRFDNIFLRDSCSCPRCLHPSTQQKLFRTVDIPKGVRPKSTTTLPDGSLQITWLNDLPGPPEAAAEEHVSTYTPEFLARYATHRERVRARFNSPAYCLWNKRQMESDVMWVEYDKYMKSDSALLGALRMLRSHGLVFIRGIPDDSDAVEGLAERIGNLKHTFYGKTWDVKSIKDSKNIAYTSLDLGLHMDLLYFESPPGLQFLHCVRNSTVGGSSVFADSFRAAELVRANSSQKFHSLTTFPVTYHYVNDDKHYHFTRPTVVLDENSYKDQKPISHTNWAPPFQGPFEVDTGAEDRSQLRAYVHAATEFADHIDNPEAQFELTLKEGECVIFQNRRVLHARRAFDPTTGDRWLKGAYVDVDAYESKLRVLSEKLKFDKEAYSYIQ